MLVESLYRRRHFFASSMPIFMPKYVSTEDGETFHLDFEDKERLRRVEIDRIELEKLIKEATILLELTSDGDAASDT